MSSNWYKKFIDLFVAGGNGAIGNLSKTDLENYEFYVPSKTEQEEIGQLFRKLDSLITLHQRKYKRYINPDKDLITKSTSLFSSS